MQRQLGKQFFSHLGCSTRHSSYKTDGSTKGLQNSWALETLRVQGEGGEGKEVLASCPWGFLWFSGFLGTMEGNWIPRIRSPGQADFSLLFCFLIPLQGLQEVFPNIHIPHCQFYQNGLFHDINSGP